MRIHKLYMRISQISWCTMPSLFLPAVSLRADYLLPARWVRSSACKYLICIVLWSIRRAFVREKSAFLPVLREPTCRRGRDAVSPRGARPARFCGRLRGRVRIGLGGDLDLDGHAQRIGGKAGPGAGDRDRLARVPGDRDPDQTVIADDAVGRIELGPAGTRQVNLEPGMGCVAADPIAASALGNMEVAGHKTAGEPERAHRLHHQHREIAAAAALQPQCIDRGPAAT